MHHHMLHALYPWAMAFLTAYLVMICYLAQFCLGNHRLEVKTHMLLVQTVDPGIITRGVSSSLDSDHK